MTRLKKSTIISISRNGLTCDNKAMRLNIGHSCIQTASMHLHEYNSILSALAGQSIEFSKIPSVRTSAGLKIVLGALSHEAWVTGNIGKKERNQLNDKLDQARTSAKKIIGACSDGTQPEAMRVAKKKLSELKFNVGKKVIDILKGRSSRRSLNIFINRSKKAPVNITNYTDEMAYMNYLGNECIDNEYTKNSGFITNLCDDSLLMAFSGFSAKRKTARAVLRIVRDFQKNSITQHPYKWKIGVVDIHGPIRQQRNIIDALYKITESNNIDLYITESIKHRHRCYVNTTDKKRLISENMPRNPIAAFGDMLGYDHAPRVIKLGPKAGSSCIVMPNMHMVANR